MGTIHEIRAMSQLFSECSFQHIKRKSNQAAHELAQLALRRKQCRELRFDNPGEISRAIEKDVESLVIATSNSST
jgi:hypothetical protein